MSQTRRCRSLRPSGLDLGPVRPLPLERFAQLSGGPGEIVFRADQRRGEAEHGEERVRTREAPGRNTVRLMTNLAWRERPLGMTIATACSRR